MIQETLPMIRSLLAFGLWLGLAAAALAQTLTLPQLGVDRATRPSGPWTLYERGLAGVQAPILIVDPVGGSLSLPPLNVPYTATGLNTKLDELRVSAGGCPTSYEFDAGPTGTPNTSTAAITGCTVTPAGTYSGNATWPDIGIQGIVANGQGASGKSAVAFLGLGGITASGSFVEEFNGVISNSPPGAQSGDGNGFDASFLTGVESDINIVAKPGGVAPNVSGGIIGVESFLTGSNAVQATGGPKSAFQAATANAQVWDTVLKANNGAAAQFLNSGAQGMANGSNGMVNYRNAISPTGAAVTASDQLDNAGTLHFNVPSAIDLNAPSIEIAEKIFAVLNTNFTQIYDPAGNAGLLLGNGTAYISENSIALRNTAGSSNFATFSAAGEVLTGGLKAASLPTSGGTVKGSLCIDTTGLVYVKTTSGACL